MVMNIEVFLGASRLRAVPLYDNTMTIGRGSSNEICLPSDKVSRNHGEIIRKNGECYFKDVSTNGTKVDSQTIHMGEKKIKHGSVIIIGDYRLYLNESATNDPAETRTQDVEEDAGQEKRTILYQLEYKDPTTGEKALANITDDFFSVGCDDKNQRVIKNKDLGGVHFCIKIIDDRAFLQECEENTYLNGKQIGIDPVCLEEGDKIKAGNIVFTVLCSNKHFENYKYHIVTQSDEMLSVIQQIEKTACFYDRSVLITGETGTGKELVANAIHFVSNRADKPFVSVNCGSIRKELAESLLFGFTKGSFTNATDDRMGFFQQAEGGTLFLDELCELSPDIQASLLRAIEYKEINPLGSEQKIKVDVRIIAATNKKVDSAAERAKINFKDDFYFRFCGLKIHVPALRERKKDIPLLMDHFLRVAKAENKNLGKYQFSASAYEIAKTYTWPGNVRELKGACEGALFESDSNIIKLVCPFTVELERSKLKLEHLSYSQEESRIIEMLGSGMTNTDVAKRLNISRVTLYRRLKKMNLVQKN